MNHGGRILIGMGLLVVACGAVVVVLGKAGVPLGRLPGDFSWRGKHGTVYFPLGTSILLSVVLSMIFWMLSRSGK
jgi:ribose/xylose/arabinose/galactoside ABC-type transport system permease subunit